MGDMSTDLDKLHAICQKTYKEQAVWFLNCFWEDFASKEAELLWSYVEKNAELDLENHELGCGLDEMKAHVFLEKFDETLTVRDMREKLRSTGAIGQSERPKLVPLTHYLLYKYNADWHLLVDESRQGDNKEEMEKAEAMLAEVQAAFKESEKKAGEARQALVEAQVKKLMLKHVKVKQFNEKMKLLLVKMLPMLLLKKPRNVKLKLRPLLKKLVQEKNKQTKMLPQQNKLKLKHKLLKENLKLLLLN